MNKNTEFLQQAKLVKAIAGIVSIISAPILFTQAILLCVAHFHFLRMMNDIILASMLLAGGITTLAGRSKLTGGTENIVVFAIGLGFGLLGFGRLWYWAVWAALCLAASIYFRVNSQRILRGEEVNSVPYEAAGHVVQAAADAAQNAVDAAQNAAQNAAEYIRAQQPQHQQYQAKQPQQQAAQQPYVPQAAQAAAQGYTAPFSVQPAKTLAEREQEILARKAAEQPADAPQAQTYPPQQ